MTEAKERQAAAELTRDGMVAQIDILKDQIGQMEQALAARNEAGTQNEQAAAELRQRLEAAEAARDQAIARIDSAGQTTTGLEATLAGAAAQVEEKSRRVKGLEEELRQAREEVARHLDAAAQAKASLEAQLAAGAAQMQEKAKRLEALEEDLRYARREAAAHFDSATQVRANLEANLAAGNAQIQEKTQRLEALEGELRQARSEAGSHLESAAQARASLEANLATSAAQMEEKVRNLERLSDELNQARGAVDSARAEMGEQRARLAALEESLEQERRHGAEKLALIGAAREEMTQQFKALAEEVISRHTAGMSQQNLAEIEVVLTPLRERLNEFHHGLLSVHDESVKERQALADQIRRLSDNSAQMASETQQLASLLKSKAEGLGAWGEVLLSSILERSGLREGQDYVYRERYSEGDQRLRPDIVISLPGDQRVVIDSNVPLAAFEAYVNAENDAVSAVHVADHASAMAGHIRALAGREPPPAEESQRDYTVMFVPVEGALAAALRHDPSLTGLAVENNIALATPGTLTMALRSVANVWQAERRNRRAEAIAERAGKLYDGFALYLGDMELLGDHLVRARHAYEEALARLSSGRDNLIGQVEELKEMGARGTKPLPKISAGERRFEPSSTETGPGLEETQVAAPANEDTVVGT